MTQIIEGVYVITVDDFEYFSMKNQDTVSTYLESSD